VALALTLPGWTPKLLGGSGLSKYVRGVQLGMALKDKRDLKSQKKPWEP